MAHKTTSKEAFYASLDQLDNVNDDSQDEEDKSFARLLSKSKESEPTIRVVPSPPVASLPRSNTAPQNSSSVASPVEDVTKVQEESVVAADVKVPTMKRTKTTGTIAENKPESAAKRRRTYTSKAVPEQQRIFKGLTFCPSYPHLSVQY